MSFTKWTLGSAKELARIWRFLDRLTRRAWEPYSKNAPGFPKQTSSRGYLNKDGKLIPELYMAINYAAGALYGLLTTASPKTPPPPPSLSAPEGADIGATTGWEPWSHDVAFEVIRSNALRSVSDATLKTSAFLKLLNRSGGARQTHERYLFRGQRDIRWEVRSRLGRKCFERIKTGTWTPPSNPLVVTPDELRALTSFQTAWTSYPDIDLLDKTITIGPTDSAWWGRMQHYDPGDGTRLLDVTTSVHFALLFACLNWDNGRVADTEEDVDGVVYAIPEEHNCRVDDFALRTAPAAADFFTSDADAAYQVFNPPHNERSKAQGGAYIWWPKFWETSKVTSYWFRVPKEDKREIARELLSFGVGPKEAVRGTKGLENESALRKDLGMKVWAPLT